MPRSIYRPFSGKTHPCELFDKSDWWRLNIGQVISFLGTHSLTTLNYLAWAEYQRCESWTADERL